MLDAHRHVSEIFKLNKPSLYLPPNQVFNKTNFEFLMTIGGHVVDGEVEYNRLTRFLSEIGETHLIIYENLGATITKRKIANQSVVELSTPFSEFDNILDRFEPASVGFMINHFFVCGTMPNWGIYICERPTINIIGCSIQLVDGFREVFGIKTNGLSTLEEFILKDSSQEWLDLFKQNYLSAHVG